MDVTMTDNEIIKAVDKCLRADDCHTSECPFFDGNEDSWDCKLVALNFVFDLINRQKAEIAELQHRNSELDIELKAMRGAANSYKAKVERLQKYDEERDIRLHARLTEKARAEAIK